MAKKAKKLSNPKQVVSKEKLTRGIGKDKLTRIEIFRTLADNTGLPKVHIESVFAALTELVHSHMRKRGSGEFTIPMIGVKVRRVKKKPTKARKMVSPLTGQEVTIAGKPARMAVKISALKPLKLAVTE
jgi:nucleoid DNA-binding protein